MWSLTRQRHRYLPTSMLYSMPAERRGPADLVADSNGCAAGNTLEEAILQGFYELAERDAFAIWWYNRLRVPAVDLSRFDDEYLASASDHYARYERDLWMLDVTSDLGIPTFVALSRRPDARVRGHHLRRRGPRRPAVGRPACDLRIEPVPYLAARSREGRRSSHDRRSAGALVVEDRSTRRLFLAGAGGGRAAHRGFTCSVIESTDTREDVEKCRALVEARGMEFLVLDQTRPDIGMPVARVVVPGMRHFWARFAPGRLYDVPVRMGWRKHPLAEADLNPAPVIA